MSVAHAELLPLPAHRATTREFAGVSTQSRALSFSVRRTVRPFIEAWSYAPRLAFPLVPVPGTHRRRVDLPTCPAELLWAPGAAPPAAQVGTDGTAVRANIDSTAVLYLHGGAFLCCGLTTHRHLVSRISAATGAPVLAVGYRMLPRHPIRRAVEDGLDGLRWLVAHGYPVERVVIAGDSAGGFLTFAVAHEAVRLGIGRPAGTVALSPLTDLDPRGKLDHPNSHRCAVFPRRAVGDQLAVLHDVARAVHAEHGGDAPFAAVDGHEPPFLGGADHDAHVGPSSIAPSASVAKAPSRSPPPSISTCPRCLPHSSRPDPRR